MLYVCLGEYEIEEYARVSQLDDRKIGCDLSV
jgi:hypothetical protein